MYQDHSRWQTHPQYFQQSSNLQQSWPSYSQQLSFNGYYPQQSWQPQSYPQQAGYQGGYQQGGYHGGLNQPYEGYYPGYYPGQQQKNGGLLAAFQTKDGKFDYNKAFVTVDQVMKTASQIGPLFKQVGSFFTMLSP
ncbi:hypothetical protein CR205_04200 [Alteribacter lacisalsi]|uniref:YppG-like protein n=1 Tax=Alteribacter lacisalsi TaxID=2045244 RepID=A0A2W0H7G0_9BACI|nr:YppG family protein [Alteribacter lacisalsi]PYZ97803.1 hypothetical protein CR205_04200 [Alteribacter lacisalsi]